MRDPKTVSVLVVDDDESLRHAIKFDLGRRGFKVYDAANGRDAFTIIQEKSIDAILTDVRMPGGDGVELLRRIKARNPKIPVLMFITGFADMTLEDAYNEGADAVFSKPFDRKLLLDAILRAVSDKNEVWARRFHERVESDIAVQLKTGGIVLKSKALNIGRGGVFVAMTEKFPQIGTMVAFQLELQKNPPAIAEGKGIVRWIRAQSTAGFPAGCGIEFYELDENCRDEIIRYIASLKTKPFIPNR